MNDFKNRSPYIELCLCRRCASVYYDDPTYWIERAEIFQDELHMCDICHQRYGLDYSIGESQVRDLKNRIVEEVSENGYD